MVENTSGQVREKVEEGRVVQGCQKRGRGQGNLDFTLRAVGSFRVEQKRLHDLERSLQVQGRRQD